MGLFASFILALSSFVLELIKKPHVCLHEFEIAAEEQKNVG